MDKVAERGFLVNQHEAKALQEGRQTQFRRIIKPQPEKDGWLFTENIGDRGLWIIDQPSGDLCTFSCPFGQVGDRLWAKHKYYVLDEQFIPTTDILYRLTDDRIYAILTLEAQDGRYKVAEWSPSEDHPDFPKRGLYGGFRRTDLLKDKICGLWAQGLRGLVSAQRTQQWEGISSNFNVPPEQEGDENRASAGLYSFSWDATIPVISNQTLRRKQEEQLARKSEMGNASRELARQRGSRQGHQRREAPNGETHQLRDESSEMGDREKASEPATGSQSSWDVSGWHLRYCPQKALRLRPSIHMPRWASRFTREITEIRVERVGEITPWDIVAEGCPFRIDDEDGSQVTEWFAELWDSIHGEGAWQRDDWVWVLSTRMLEQ